MKLHLDTFEYLSKPSGREIGLISRRIINHQVNIDVKELVEAIEKGKTFTPATFKFITGELRRSNRNWESQQIIALDFDEGLTLEEAYRDEFFMEYAAFLYTTFSHTKEHNKFRVVFVLDKPLTDYRQFELLMNYLLERYPYADKACKDGSRLFFGGRQITPINYENRLSVDEHINRTPLQDIKNNLYMSANTLSVHDTHNNNLWINNNVELIKNRDVQALQEILLLKPVCLSKNEVLDYLKKQDLRTFLGIDSSSNFIDIFHDESNPSASIFQSSKNNGHWLYKCHSQSHPFNGTIEYVVQRLLDCTMAEAVAFLVQVFDIEIYESEAVKEYKNSIETYKEVLVSEKLKEIHPNFYKVFSSYGYLKDFYMLLDLTQEYIIDEPNPKIIFYHSVNTLAKTFGRSKSSTGTRINLFSLFGLIRKLDEEDIPESLLNIQNSNKRNNKYRYRNSTYELPLYTYDFFNEVDRMCAIWLEKGCTSRTISYEGILRTFGRDVANRIFPQDKNKEIAELNEVIVTQIKYTTLNLIDEKEWTTQKEVLDNITLYFKGQQEFKTTQLKRCIGEMIDDYDLELIASNKKIKEDMGITEEFMSKNSFPKIIRKKPHNGLQSITRQ